MAKQVNALTVKELEQLIQKAIHKELQSLIIDPDYGFELRDEIAEKLRLSLASKKRYSIADVKKKIKASCGTR
jgi:signal recognition particle GTPase